MDQLYEKLAIGGKDVYIVEAHHFVLMPWAHIRRGLETAPTLITLDHHTDTVDAFRGHRYRATKGDSDRSNAMLPELIASIDWKDDKSLLKAVSMLRHDEHIHTAFLAGIISCAFAINLSDQLPSVEEDAFSEATSRRFNQLLARMAPEPMPDRPTPPFNYARRDDGMFTISADCAIGCDNVPHDDECVVVRAGQVLESLYLDHELATANRMATCMGLASVEAEPYILDIDLDYFHSEKAITPADASTFHRLVRNAIAVTVALEPECVEELRCDDSKVTAPWLLERLKEHIDAAMK
ncbi:UPF0489 family protein [Burkholderia pyrrocinia]|uniref:UPF0489 family protein n=1 Tax=Burkholderia pyrrocinia TaxID=60550 RepID=UPI001FB41C94|nr:UPF0489 family protein [Burkholderia pyrrocinia]UOB57000.1 UPF0489 family protein [Burkholderia pyrrocinia]